MKLIGFITLLILYSQTALSCLPCVEKYQPAKLIAYTEPLWLQKEVPVENKGIVKVVFDLTKDGNPFNVKVKMKSSELLSDEKLIKSIKRALFSLESIQCMEKEGEINKNISHTFKLSFDNVL